MKKKLLIVFIVVAFLGLEAYVAYSIGRNNHAERLSQDAAAEALESPSSEILASSSQSSPLVSEEEISVTTVRIEAQDIFNTHSFYGSAMPYAEANVQGEYSGKIIALPLKEGDVVKKGKVMVRFDDSDVRLQLAQARSEKETALQQVNQAQSNLSTVQADVERQKKLFDDGIISKKMFDDAKNQLQSAESGLNSAHEKVKQAEAQSALLENTLKDFTVHAPLSGIIDEKRYNSNEVYQAGDILYHIVDLHKVYVELEVPERYISQITDGMEVEVTFDSLDGRRFPALITHILPRSDEQNRNFLVKALVENPEGRIKPGMFARIDASLQSISEAFVIDPKALIKDGERYYIFKVLDLKAEKVVVDVKQYGENSVAIVSEGLQSDDTIVVEGAQLLRPNARLKIKI